MPKTQVHFAQGEGLSGLPTCHLIGAGKAGKTLAKLLHDNHLVAIGSVLNRSLPSAQDACQFIGAGTPVQHLNQLPPADLILIGVPDGAIQAVCEEWAKSSSFKPGTLVFHLSGALSSQVLESAQKRGALIASLHPLKTFASPQQAYESFSGTFCALEGQDEALQVLIPLAEAIGGKTGIIAAQNKPLYHAACVMACGGLTGLVAACEDILARVGLPEVQLGGYMKATLDNIMQMGAASALTGPVARGDGLTVAAHEKAMQSQDPCFQDLYQILTELQRRV